MISRRCDSRAIQGYEFERYDMVVPEDRVKLPIAQILKPERGRPISVGRVCYSRQV